MIFGGNKNWSDEKSFMGLGRDGCTISAGIANMRVHEE